MQKNLKCAIIGKFSYGKSGIIELRRLLPSQYGIKGKSNIGVLDSRHILIILDVMEDYVNLLSTAAYYIKANDRYWQMRMLKWDPWFKLDMETTIGVA